MEHGRPFSETAGNWLKGALVRAYTAQRDHFLELHARSGAAFPRRRPADEGETGREEAQPQSPER